MANKIKRNVNNIFYRYLKGSCKSSFFLNPITEIELEFELKNMKSNKSCRYDGIITNIAKLIAKEISKPLTHIFNLTFATGIIPDNLQVAFITPISKANDAMKFENYRPISVLVCFYKLLERLMINRLSKFVDKNKILSKHQYGFREKRSAEHALIDFIDKITKAIDEGKYPIGIFLDLFKAFDTIDHKILIRKLEHYGIGGVAKEWFEIFFVQ